MPTRNTAVRGIEAFLFVVVSAFLTQITVLGHPIDLTRSDSQAAVLTALIAALGIAVRQWQATQGSK